MSPLTTRLRRTLAATTAAGVAAVGLTLVPSAPAHAAEPAPLELDWEFSQTFDSSFATHTYAGEVTEDDDGVVTFTDGVASVVNGSRQVAFEGSVTGTATGRGDYSVTFADPVVTLDDDGGEISAEVSAFVPESNRGPEVTVAPARVVLVTFDPTTGLWANSPDGSATLTATPDYDGVIVPDSETAADLEIPATFPTDGKAWNPDFLAHLKPSGLISHFYASGAASDANKVPAPFTVDLAPALGAEVTSATSTGVAVTVTGIGFESFAAPEPGVYVGLAPAGGLPAELDMADAGTLADFVWLSGAAITDGAFSTTLEAPAAKLDRTKSHAVYVWRAHTNPVPESTFEAPVAIDWASVFPPAAPCTPVDVSALEKKVDKLKKAFQKAKKKLKQAKRSDASKKRIQKAKKKVKKTKKKLKQARRAVASAPTCR